MEPIAASAQVQFVDVPEEHRGRRLDNFLARLLKGVPRSRLYRLVRRGEVRVNGKRCRPERRLERGDRVRIPPFARVDGRPPPAPGGRLAEALAGAVLLENERLLVIDKPAGVAVHGGSGVRLGLIEAMRQLRPEWARLELAHRLDRDTSGCLVLAKDMAFLKDLQRQLKDRSVEKRYLALVTGRWPESLRLVDAPLAKNRLSSGERVVRVEPSGKPARTRFRPLRRLSGTTLIEAMPLTGRTHQIRVHCLHAGHPIVGDGKYRLGRGGPAAGGRLRLHAAAIGFAESPGGAVVEVEAPAPDWASETG